MNLDYEQFDALALAAMVARREVTAVDLLAAAETKCAERDSDLGAIVHRFFDLGHGLAQAGLPKGPFQGVPLMVKDAGLSVADTPLSWGSRLYADRRCGHDDTLATRLKAAGLVPVARTKAPEFSLSFTTEPQAFDPARNPWAPTRSCGGSSGGAAAAVAAGLVPVAHASDGAGSIRVPAAHCGVFGFKPSRIRNPIGPAVAEGNAGMGTPHAITRTVRDSAALLDATAGPDIGDPYAVAPPRTAFLDETERDPPSLRIGLIRTPSVEVPVDPACLAAVDHAARLCANLGHDVEEATTDYDGEGLKQAWRVIAGTGLAAAVGPRLRDISGADAAILVEPVNQAWIEEGRGWSAMDYLAAVGALHTAGRVMGRFFARFDVLLSPVTAQLAAPLGSLAGDGATLDEFYDRFWAHAPFAPIFNAAGLPAMSVPLYWTQPLSDAPGGLPVGVQFGAGVGKDGLLFALAAQLERAQPWATRRPPSPPARMR